jgi:uncharacterized protein (DUF58 family)
VSRILPFLAVLLAVAFFTRVNFFFYLLYCLFGIYFLGRLWASRSVAAVTVERRHEPRMFFGQSQVVQLDVHNRGWLPVLWLRLSDTVPFDLMGGAAFRRVFSLWPGERQHHEYRLHGRRRGYYRLGPLVSLGGDLLGTAAYERHLGGDDWVIVYPRIVPLRDLGLPSQSPFGVLPSRQRLFEDPARIRGVRDYQPGDSLRRVDWKTSARVGQLQVRRYEPAIALETALFLNLAAAEYPQACRLNATELGIVVCASLAVHLAEQRQAVALVTNGNDLPRDVQPAAGSGPTAALPLRKGREHLMHILDLLARVEVVPEDETAVPFLELLNRKSLALPWGSTVVAVTSQECEGLLETLLTLRRRGLRILLVLTCPSRGFNSTAERAAQIGVQTVRMWTEKDLDRWR